VDNIKTYNFVTYNAGRFYLAAKKQIKDKLFTQINLHFEVAVALLINLAVFF
jgi:hypothetical protein